MKIDNRILKIDNGILNVDNRLALLKKSIVKIKIDH